MYDNHNLFIKFPPKVKGPYSTYEEALFEAKDLLDKFIEEHWDSGLFPVAYTEFWKMFGETPVIVSDKRNKLERFSASDYVAEITPIII